MMPSGSRPGKNLRNLWGDLKITEKTILAISPNLVIPSICGENVRGERKLTVGRDL